MYDTHLFPASPAMKNCSDGGKVKYVTGALPGSSEDFLLKTMFLGDKDHDIFSSMSSQADRSVISKNKHTQVQFNGWIA